MAIECAYSFKDLYIAANGILPTDNELNELYKLHQRERNKTVSDWAQKAKWQTRRRVGSDGQVYFAFAPKFSD